jgi:hypothetical protein
MSFKPRKFAVQIFGCLPVRDYRSLFGAKKAQISGACLFGPDKGRPFAFFFIPIHTLISAFVVTLRASILRTLGRCYVSYFVPTVVPGSTIFVIDDVFRPSSSHDEKCKAMCKIHASFDSYTDVSVGIGDTGNASFFTSWWPVYIPYQITSFGVVAQQIAYEGCVKIVVRRARSCFAVFSHLTLLKSSWLEVGLSAATLSYLAIMEDAPCR